MGPSLLHERLRSAPSWNLREAPAETGFSRRQAGHAHLFPFLPLRGGRKTRPLILPHAPLPKSPLTEPGLECPGHLQGIRNDHVSLPRQSLRHRGHLLPPRLRSPALGGMLGATSGVVLWRGPRVEGQRQMPETPASQRWVRAHSPPPWGRVVCGHPQGVTEIPAEHGRAEPPEDALVSCPAL